MDKEVADVRGIMEELLLKEAAEAYPWERKSAEEIATRRLRKPETNLGEGRARFELLLSRTINDLRRGCSLCDFGAFPGTFLRIARSLGGGGLRLTAAGMSFAPEYLKALSQADIKVLSLEFDIRYPRYSNGVHILTYPLEQSEAPFDTAICTEVIEHQMYPLSLLAGMNRFLKIGGRLYLTTNSVCFIGDILRLSSGRQNMEELHRSHVLSDSQWRPHIRLYTLEELKELLSLSGFAVEEAFYFDNGSVYGGLKGLAMSALRATASAVAPYLRSHIFISARKSGDPAAFAQECIRETVTNYNLAPVIQY